MTHGESKRKDMKKRAGKAGAKKAQKATDAAKTDVMKMTLFDAPVVPRSQTRERRTGGRQPSGKRIPIPRNERARQTVRRSLDPSDSSNDSGLGFDNHMESPSNSDSTQWIEDRLHPKRQKMEVKLESDDINENYCFPERTNIYRDNTTLIRTAPSASLTSLTVSNTQSNTSRKSIPRCLPLLNKSLPSTPITLTTQLQTVSRYSDISLSIICQPEQQHRARYQTEGSRGAVKDRSGHGFPVVQLVGYNKPTTLQVFIGSDVGKVMPHMFYQACKVSGKNSTPCSEKKIDGTIVIELQLDPNKEMTATCDCVGILKERNVDVEHRFPDQLASRSKKKSTRCRMVFRTSIVHDDGYQETLQVCSQPIVCTQPPGIPEISKKSLSTCPANGGMELFIIGKNFLKDTMVYFQCGDDAHPTWEKGVTPDKEFLQQTHLVCVVPPYVNRDITESVNVRLYVVSSGKASEAHQFVYTPVNGSVQSVNTEPVQPQTTPFLAKMWTSMGNQEQDVGMMPPPGTNLVPVSQRRSSLSLLSTSGETQSPPAKTLKQEMIDENSQNSIADPSEVGSEPAQVPFLKWSAMSKQDQDVGMMPPPGTSLVPVSQRRSSLNLLSSETVNHSPPMRTLKHEMIDENSQNSIMDPSELPHRYRHISESSMDAHQGDSNMSMINDNSIDMIRQNSMMGISQSDNSNLTMDDLRRDELSIMDLRMKLPMSTVEDLVNTKEPSLATLRSFGVTENNQITLTAQSAQSIENYLTNIETKQAFLMKPESTATSQSAFIKNTVPSTQINSFVISRSEETQRIFETRSANSSFSNDTVSGQSVTFVTQTESIPVALISSQTKTSTFINTQTDNNSSYITQPATEGVGDVNFVTQQQNCQQGGFVGQTAKAGVTGQNVNFVQNENISTAAQTAGFLTQATESAVTFVTKNLPAVTQPGEFIQAKPQVEQNTITSFIPQPETQNVNFFSRSDSRPGTNFITQSETSFMAQTETNSTGFIAQTEARNLNFLPQVQTEAANFIQQQSEPQSSTFIQQNEPQQNPSFITQAEAQSFITQTEPQNANFITKPQNEGFEQQGANFISRTEQQGANFIPHTEQQGTNFIPSTEQQGNNFIPRTEQQGTNFISTSEQQGNNFIPRTEQRGTNFISRTEQQGTNFIPSTEQQCTNFMQQPAQNAATNFVPTEQQGSNFLSQSEVQGGNFIPQNETQGGNFKQSPTGFISEPKQNSNNFDVQTGFENVRRPSASFETQNNFVPVAENTGYIEKAVEGVQQNTVLPTGISPEKLDALVNCAVETHITTQKSSEVLLSTQDVILNAPLQPIITTTLESNQINPATISVDSSIPSEIILNSQISPSIMCRNTNVEDKQQIFPSVNVVDQEKQQIFPGVNQEKPIFSNVAVQESISIGTNEPEKAIILNAAADLLETQKKINDMQTTLPEQNVRMISILTTTTSDSGLFKISTDKKSEERMIPSSFATMSENDLINIINPSCFDQV